MSDEEGGLDPVSDLAGLDELLASPTEPLSDEDDEITGAPGLYVPPSRGLASGGSRPLPVDMSRLDDEPPPSGGTAAAGRPVGPPATTATTSPAAESGRARTEQMPAESTAEPPPFVSPDADLGPTVGADEALAAAVHRGPRWHPPPVKAPPLATPLDVGPVGPPPSPPPPAPSAGPAAAVPAGSRPESRQVPERRAHPRVRRWFGRNRDETIDDTESRGQAPGAS